jgi:hypothetical protein
MGKRRLLMNSRTCAVCMSVRPEEREAIRELARSMGMTNISLIRSRLPEIFGDDIGRLPYRRLYKESGQLDIDNFIKKKKPKPELLSKSEAIQAMRKARGE